MNQARETNAREDRLPGGAGPGHREVQGVEGESLEALLALVSRSFSLSIRVLPPAVRGPIGVGYLLARAADTIADTDAVPADERRALLELLRQAVEGEGDAGDAALVARLRGLVPSPGNGADRAQVMTAGQSTSAEVRLLLRVPECLAVLRAQTPGDQGRLHRVLGQLIHGMVTDLARFPAAPAGAGGGPGAPAAASVGAAVPPVASLATWAELDEYTYYAAGCVGEFWTAVTAAHVPALAHLSRPDLLERGVWLGQALQMVNVLRDAPADLRAGRCYWPAEALASRGLRPEDLVALARGATASSTQRQAVLDVTADLLARARDLATRAWPYVQAIPPAEVRLRLACTWPLLLGLDTLAQLERVGSPLLSPGQVVKVRRGQVYRMLATSALAAMVDGLRGRDGVLDRVRGRRQGS